MSLRGVNVLSGSSSWPELHTFLALSSTSNSQRICRRPTLLRQKPGCHNFGILPRQLHTHGHLLSAPVVRHSRYSLVVNKGLVRCWATGRVP